MSEATNTKDMLRIVAITPLGTFESGWSDPISGNELNRFREMLKDCGELSMVTPEGATLYLQRELIKRSIFRLEVRPIR